MNFIKTKPEIIIGFIALIISLGTFKEELASVKFDLMYMHLTLAQYLLGIIGGFTFYIWINFMESVVSGTTAGKSKLFDHFQTFAHKLLMAILYSPFVVIVNLILVYGNHTELTGRVDEIFTGIFRTLFACVAVRGFVNVFIHESYPIPGIEIMVRGLQKQDRKKIEPLIEFGMNGAYHLFAKGCFKIIKNDLQFRLKQMNIQVSRGKRPFIIRTAWKAGILDAKDLIIIRQIWKTISLKAKGDKINMKNIHDAIEYLRRFIIKGYNSATNEQFERA